MKRFACCAVCGCGDRSTATGVDFASPRDGELVTLVEQHDDSFEPIDVTEGFLSIPFRGASGRGDGRVTGCLGDDFVSGVFVSDVFASAGFDSISTTEDCETAGCWMELFAGWIFGRP